MSLRGVVAFLWLALVFGAGCVPSAAPGTFPAESISVPGAVDDYTTAVQPDGAVGGPGVERLAADIAAALSERGERAEADGALAATASFALSEVNRGRTIDQVTLEAASRRFGFAGVVLSTSIFDTRQKDAWREHLEKIAHNVAITRFGIRVSPSGRSAAVVYGAAELEYAAIPRKLEPGRSIALKGTIAPRFRSCQVYLTNPDGKVVERKLSGRTFDVSFALTEPGKYQLEVMGDGASGPVVLSNVPLYVGIPEPDALALAGTVVEPEQAEIRMLELLNDARQRAGLSRLKPDDELRELALAHSTDMADHHFFGHVSPTTGTPEERVRRSGVLVSLTGENVALAATPEGAHEGLMNSPGHRANMLRPEFTHVGIGARNGQSGLLATQVFGRRPPPDSVPADAAAVEAAIATLRAQKQLPALKIDPIYGAAAQAGADAFAGGADAEAIGEAVQSALQREVNRRKSSRPAACTFSMEMLELIQLGELPALSRPELRRIGIGARTHRDAKGTRLSTVLLLEGVPCR